MPTSRSLTMRTRRTRDSRNHSRFAHTRRVNSQIHSHIHSRSAHTRRVNSRIHSHVHSQIEISKVFCPRRAHTRRHRGLMVFVCSPSPIHAVNGPRGQLGSCAPEIGRSSSASGTRRRGRIGGHEDFRAGGRSCEAASRHARRVRSPVPCRPTAVGHLAGRGSDGRSARTPRSRQGRVNRHRWRVGGVAGRSRSLETHRVATVRALPRCHYDSVVRGLSGCRRATQTTDGFAGQAGDQAARS